MEASSALWQQLPTCRVGSCCQTAKPANAVTSRHRRCLRATREVSTRPRPNASMRPHRPGMSRSSSWPMVVGSAGSDDEVFADRFEAEHRSQEQKGRAGRPRLGTARGGVLHRVLRHRARVAAECFGQSAVEERRRPRGCPTATRAASSLKPYRRSPHAMNELSNGQMVPMW